ncbi:hypothetical protein CPB85DRAFT_390477 [Mucidula mucida]|nr:hypothetical protein CPB85DRAFT_390477 [Mucidula mucida]
MPYRAKRLGPSTDFPSFAPERRYDTTSLLLCSICAAAAAYRTCLTDLVGSVLALLQVASHQHHGPTHPDRPAFKKANFILRVLINGPLLLSLWLPPHSG